jgi:hypothetical protein
MGSGEVERRRVYTATEFKAAVAAGDAVEFEIGHGYMLRSDVRLPDFLQKRLENMVEAERVLGQEFRASPPEVTFDERI